jgi:signal transduction histidine kinase
MKKTVICLACLFLMVTASGTTRSYLDSVEQVLDTTKTLSTRLLCLYTLSYEYGLIQPHKGILFGKQCLIEAIAAKDISYQLNAYNGLGNAFETLSRFDSAKYYHHQSYLMAVQMRSPNKMALTLSNIALCDKELGNYRLALDHYLKAYKILERQQVYNPRVHVSISDMYLRLGDYKEAEFHSRRGIQKCIEFNQDYVVYNLYVNLAKCQLHAKQYDQAIGSLQHAITGLLKNTDEFSIATCYQALGDAYVAKGIFQKAYDNYTKAHVYYANLNNANGRLLSAMKAARTLVCMGTKSGSQLTALLSETETLFRKVLPNNDMLPEAYETGAETYEKLGNNTKAIDYYKHGFVLKDSLLSRERVNQMQELQVQYETQKKEFEIVTLKQSDLIKSLEIKDKDQSIQRKNTIMIIGAFLMICLGGAVYFRVQKQKLRLVFEKQLAVKDTEEKERIRMAKDIHDDLGSGLSRISFLSELILQNKGADTTENAEAIMETSRKLVVNMRDLIWALDPENTSLQGLVARIREYSNDYLEDFSIKLNLDEKNNAAQQPVSKESYRAVLMIVKESLNNIVKHAKASVVDMQISIDSKVFTLTISDNGLGMADQQRRGNGIRNMKTRIEAVGGEFVLNTENNRGTSIGVRFTFANN